MTSNGGHPWNLLGDFHTLHVQMLLVTNSQPELRNPWGTLWPLACFLPIPWRRQPGPDSLFQRDIPQPDICTGESEWGSDLCFPQEHWETCHPSGSLPVSCLPYRQLWVIYVVFLSPSHFSKSSMRGDSANVRAGRRSPRLVLHWLSGGTLFQNVLRWDLGLALQ